MTHCATQAAQHWLTLAHQFAPLARGRGVEEDSYATFAIARANELFDEVAKRESEGQDDAWKAKDCLKGWANGIMGVAIGNKFGRRGVKMHIKAKTRDMSMFAGGTV